ncbi:MAG: tRNA 2-thiouridine(34) synthase MnmA [Candidatus Omnitrophota bacterium]
MKKKKVVVAMSGGVDSSVACALLKARGMEVIGVTMRLWGGGKDLAGKRNIEDARDVARKLGIRHYVLELQDVFREKVIAPFCAEYKNGRTPNPCIRCNQYIKFGALLKEAGKLEADYLATGHYARIKFDRKSKKFLLKKGLDRQKDQSYALYTLTQKQLPRILFPLGGLTKLKVREIAREKGLLIAARPESQEICFIPDNDYGGFLRKYYSAPALPGPILNTAGQEIARHKGISAYTIGQRKGIGIAAPEPLYVISIAPRANAIVVGKKKDVYRKDLIAGKASFIDSDKLGKPARVKVKVRYRHPAAWAMVFPLSKNRVKVKFDRPQWAITPGQAAVFYQRDTVIGGGTIRG